MAQIEIGAGEDEQITPSGIIMLKKLTTEHALLIADALATTVMLAHDERSVSAVFDFISRWARTRAARAHAGRAARDPQAHRQRASGAAARPASSRSRRSPTSCGSGRTWSGSTPSSKIGMSSRSAPTC